MIDIHAKQAYIVIIERMNDRKEIEMADFIIINNETNEIMAELENYDFSEIIYATDFVDVAEEAGTDWFSVYHVGDTATTKEAVYYNGNWYEADGYTVLNY